MDRTLDQTTLETVALLEARLLRVQHMLFGHAELPDAVAPEDSVWERVALLDREFNRMVCHVKAYSALLNICTHGGGEDAPRRLSDHGAPSC
jgi:hypothetical protein